ncbi:hypothetical protein J3U91_01071 [Oenococcus oeni]|uniref:Uncharacterized protein n=2 Tax=Oenococcus oeni TaxID=1247 RepID=Q04F25_OENOB|nr:hypothetical protein OEOE_1040 [Oenococcus oeni PSU-1]EFD88597.1 hypothetical protein AWRIB429_1017 [Oenococcus oeni AWRIB429]KEP85669.1 hypothetical protein X278_06505 [Oenococcus oeni IOEB_0205]KZD14254.1 hypothetical protein AC229_0908 [Oenococcus oeni]UCU86910.1 hypothetical protein J3U91_01071 [Oenococcus oeni]
MYESKLQDTVDIFSDFQNMDIYKTYFINSKQPGFNFI